MITKQRQQTKGAARAEEIRKEDESFQEKNPAEAKGASQGTRSGEPGSDATASVAANGASLSGVRDAVESVAAEAGLLVMKALIDDEVEQYAGPKDQHNSERQGHRWGSEEGYVVFSGRKVPIKRPRVRGVDGKEKALERYKLFQTPTAMQDSVGESVVCGVTTRDYEKVIDDVCETGTASARAR